MPMLLLRKPPLQPGHARRRAPTTPGSMRLLRRWVRLRMPPPPLPLPCPPLRTPIGLPSPHPTPPPRCGLLRGLRALSRAACGRSWGRPRRPARHAAGHVCARRCVCEMTAGARRRPPAAAQAGVRLFAVRCLLFAVRAQPRAPSSPALANGQSRGLAQTNSWPAQRESGRAPRPTAGRRRFTIQTTPVARPSGQKSRSHFSLLPPKSRGGSQASSRPSR